MHALLIGEVWLRADAVGLHQEFLTVASAACGRYVQAADRRLAVRHSQNFVRSPVTVATVGGGLAGPACVGVSAVRIGLLRIRVALVASDLLWSCFVSHALHVGVAIHACKHRSVDRLLQLAWIDIETDALTVDHRCQRGIGVAREAVIVFWLFFRVSDKSPAKQEEWDR